MHKWVEMNSTLCRNYETWWWTAAALIIRTSGLYYDFLSHFRMNIENKENSLDDTEKWKRLPLLGVQAVYHEYNEFAPHFSRVILPLISTLSSYITWIHVAYKVDMVAQEEDTGLTCSCYLGLSPTRVYPLHTKARCIRPMLPYVYLRPCNVNPIWFGNWCCWQFLYIRNNLWWRIRTMTNWATTLENVLADTCAKRSLKSVRASAVWSVFAQRNHYENTPI